MAARRQLTTLGFWQSGQRLRLLDDAIAIDCPVRLVHGDADDDVPPAIALRLIERLRSADVQLNIVKGGGHRLSDAARDRGDPAHRRRPLGASP